MKRFEKVKKGVYIVLGFFAMGLAYVGVIMPGIPGIPFILLTAFFFVRSSDRLYNKLLENRILGKLLKKVHSREKIPLGFKLFVASQLWVSIIVAEIWLLENIWWRFIVALSGIPVTVLIMRMGNSRLTKTKH